jgi:hypothetical protein
VRTSTSGDVCVYNTRARTFLVRTDRSINFGRASKRSNERKGWFLAWLMPNMYGAESATFRCACAKINKETVEVINELRESLLSHVDTPYNSKGHYVGEPDAKINDSEDLVG